VGRGSAIRQSESDRIFDVVTYAFLLLVLAAVVYPLLSFVNCSLSDPNAVVSGRVRLLPVEPTLIGYTTVFENPQVKTGYLNPLFYTSVGTLHRDLAPLRVVLLPRSRNLEASLCPTLARACELVRQEGLSRSRDPRCP